MPFATTYRQARERIGRLNSLLTFITPVRTRTATGGEKSQWVTWATTRGMVDNIGGTEATDADRKTAINTKAFTIRTKSVPSLSELMAIQYNDQTYDIERVDIDTDLPRNAYTKIEAVRRDSPITAVGDLSNLLTFDWSQAFANVTGTALEITAGTLIDAGTYSAAEINQYLFVFRNGLRLTYAAADDLGFTIDNLTNEILPVMAFGEENFLVGQYISA